MNNPYINEDNADNASAVNNAATTQPSAIDNAINNAANAKSQFPKNKPNPSPSLTSPKPIQVLPSP